MFNLAVEKVWTAPKAEDGINFRLLIVETRRLSLPNLAKGT